MHSIVGGNRTTVQKMGTDNRPTVSVIIPMRNEEEHITWCLESVIHQDYPKDLMEVLVVDGMSEDSSREIVADFVRRYSFVRLLNNPKRVTASALNRGIVESKGDVIMRVDAHCSINQDYVSCCVNALQQSGAGNVGGFVIPVGTNLVQKAIGIAMSSSFGIGSSRFCHGKKEMYVDTVSFGAYRRQVFEKIGLYDEEAGYGEDDELNYRLTKSGGKILLSPKITSHYYPRSSLSVLWKQYYNFGRGKLRTIKKHGRPASFRHLIPPIFVLSVIGSLMLHAIHPTFRWLTIAICGSYLVLTILFSAKSSFTQGWKYFPILPVVFATIHISYGIGFLIGTLPLCLRVHRRDSPC
jgi:cellulose synthase/poly-beta-1,6-N-acetylglucosamine synthase-like glycosyltransferase